jgi:hypothetical protein
MVSKNACMSCIRFQGPYDGQCVDLLEDQIEPTLSALGACCEGPGDGLRKKMEWASEKTRVKVKAAYTIDMEANAPEYRKHLQHLRRKLGGLE